jgi:hypothetical protein
MSSRGTINRRKKSYHRTVKGKNQRVKEHSQNYHVGKRVPHNIESDDDQLEEWIGEQALKEKRWIPLDPDYPNVLGITPERIDWFINQFPDERTLEQEKAWNRLKEYPSVNAPLLSDETAIQELISQGFTKKDIKAVIRRTHFYDRDDIFNKSKQIHQELLEKSKTEKSRDIQFINDKFDNMQEELNKEDSPLFRDVSEFFMGIYSSKDGNTFSREIQLRQLLDAPIERGHIPTDPTKENLEWLTDKYPNPNMDAVKGYITNLAETNPKDDRIHELKEKYLEIGEKTISKTDLFTVLAYKMEEIKTEKRKEESFKENAKYYNRGLMGTLGLSDQESPYDLDELVETHMKSKERKFDKGDIKIIKDSLETIRSKAFSNIQGAVPASSEETIYVTSPRGGHEILSIYSYANKLKKENIPSDILRKGEVNILQNPSYQTFEHLSSGHKLKYDVDIGMTYLGNTSGDIKRVVVIDDVVGSGQQMWQYYSTLRKKFPNAQIYYNTLAYRKFEYQSMGRDYDIKQTLKETKSRMNTLFSDRGYSEIIYADETIGTQGLAKGEKGYIGVVFPWAVPDGSSDKISRLLVQAKDDKMRNVGTRRYKKEE